MQPATILTSPLVRARETAAIAGEELSFDGDLVETEKLSPWVSPLELWEEIRAWRKDSPVMLSGHNPQLSEFVSLVIGSRAGGVDMKKGALAHLELYSLGPEPQGSLIWLLTAKTALG